MTVRKVVLAFMIMNVCVCYAPGPVNEVRQEPQLYLPFDVNFDDDHDDDEQPDYDTQEEYDDHDDDEHDDDDTQEEYDDDEGYKGEDNVNDELEKPIR